MPFFSALYNLVRTLGKNHDLPDILMDQAYGARQKGDFGRAIECYTKAIEAGRNTWIAWFYRGECKEQAGDIQGAMADYEQAITISPKYSGQAKKALERLKKAD